MAKHGGIPSDLVRSATEKPQEVEQVQEAPEKDTDGVPYCPVHFVRMKNASGGKSGGTTEYYTCPVDGCDAKKKTIRRSLLRMVPAEPTICAKCRGKSPSMSKTDKPIPMVRCDKASRSAYTVLKCPVCGAQSPPLTRPEFVAADTMRRSRENREAVEEIGAR